MTISKQEHLLLVWTVAIGLLLYIYLMDNGCVNESVNWRFKNIYNWKILQKYSSIRELVLIS